LAALGTSNGVYSNGEVETMKKVLVLMLTMVFLLSLGASAAFARHGDPHCSKSGQTHAGNSGRECYPPPGQGADNGGNPTSFGTDAPDSGGITVGMATLGALGALGVLMVARRRWVF
jgi:hypothetical protein